MVEKVVCSDEQFAKLQETYPAPNELVRVSVQPGEIVLRNPSAIEYQNFTSETWGKPGTEGYPIAYRNALVQQCVFPDRPVLLAWLSRWPGIPLSGPVMRAIKYLNGEAEALAGKG